MRKILLIILLLFAVVPPVSADVKGGIDSYETTYKVNTSDMYQMIYSDDMVGALEDLCRPADIVQAKKYAESIRKNFEQHIVWMSDAEELEWTFNWYNKLHKQQNQLYKYDDSVFCGAKYVLYHLMDHLRESHLELLEANGLFPDFDGFTSALHGYELKKQLMDVLIDRSDQYLDKLGIDLQITVNNESFPDSYSQRKQSLIEDIGQLMHQAVYKSLYQLVEAEILSQEDVDDLVGKIELEYVDSCDIFHGKYEIKETMKQDGTHIRYDTMRLLLKLNFCTNYFVLREIDQIFEQVVTHELGHHFYYYHDKERDDFMKICWNDQASNGKCDDDDYVSDYAKSLPTEDYADTFMFWFLNKEVDEIGTRLRRKYDHFDNAVQ